MSETSASLVGFVIEQTLNANGSADLVSPGSVRIILDDAAMEDIAAAAAGARVLAHLRPQSQSASIISTDIALNAQTTYFQDEAGSEEFTLADGEDEGNRFAVSSEWLSVTPGEPGQIQLKLEAWDRHDDCTLITVFSAAEVGISDDLERRVLKCYEAMNIPQDYWPQAEAHRVAAVKRDPAVLAMYDVTQQTASVVDAALQANPLTVIAIRNVTAEHWLRALEADPYVARVLPVDNLGSNAFKPIVAWLVDDNNWGRVCEQPWSAPSNYPGNPQSLVDLALKLAEVSGRDAPLPIPQRILDELGHQLRQDEQPAAVRPRQGL